MYSFSKFRGYLILAAALAVVFTLFLAIIPASARASTRASTRTSVNKVTPRSTSPADQAVLAQPPAQVSLDFPEEVGETESAVQVFDQQGRQVDLGNGGADPDDPNHASLVVKLPSLRPGVYLVKWQAALADGSISSGAYYFGVGSGPALPADSSAAVALAPAPDPLVTPWSLVGTALVAAAAAIVLAWAWRVMQ